MPTYLYLAQWARQQGIAEHTAYRQFHAGTLRDRSDRPVFAKKVRGTIRVYPEGPPPPPDPLQLVDPDALVWALERAGYVVLRRDEAERLGVRREAPQ